MSLLYKILGFFAQIGAFLSRRRVNLVKSSTLPLTVGLLGSLSLAAVTLMAMQEGTAPHTVPLKDLTDEAYLGRRYMTLHGRYILSGSYELQGKDVKSGLVPRNYVAFMDTEKTAVILVATPDGANVPDGEVTLTGMAEHLSVSMTSDLPREEQGLPFIHGFYFQQGATPASPLLMGAGCLFVAIPTALYLLAFAQLYVIFRKGDALTVPPGAPLAPQMPTLFATGRFYLQQQGSERFLEAPATLTPLPSGEIALYALVDASRQSNFYGIPTGTEQRVGYWTALIAPGSVQKVEAGLQYLGLSARWALRFSYLDAISRRRETMVIAFAEEGLRSQVRAELEKFQ